MSFQTPFSISSLVIVLFSSLFLCSCALKKPSSHVTPSCNFHLSGFDPIIPLGFACTEKRVSKERDGALLVAHYTGRTQQKNVIAFYRREMEAAGWDLSNFSDNQQGLFFCHKGRQECVISICSHGKGKTIITISYKTKASTNNSIANDMAKINRSTGR